jgi:lipoprotein-releasing system ATP-binding protein
MSEAPIISATGVSKTFREGAAAVEVLRSVDLVVRAGESVAIIGASGSGKSTLLHCLGGLDSPSAGRIAIDGEELTGMSEARRCALRNHVLGFVYQFHHLLPEFTAQENVAMPLLIRRQPRAQALAAAAEVLAAVGLGARLDHTPGELSGGERQRAALARALVTRPRCVLADEPTGNLDRGSAEGVFAMMLKLKRDFGTAIIVVTHDAALASAMDRRLELRTGQLQEA